VVSWEMVITRNWRSRTKLCSSSV